MAQAIALVSIVFGIAAEQLPLDKLMKKYGQAVWYENMKLDGLARRLGGQKANNPTE